MQAFLEALLNAWWQGILITFLVWLVLRDLPRVNAATRLAIWQFTMALVILLPVLQRVPMPEWSVFGLESQLMPQVAAPIQPKPYAGLQFQRQETAPLVDLPYSDGAELLFMLAVVLAGAQLLRILIAFWALRRLKLRSDNTDVTLPLFLDREVSVRLSDKIGMPMALGYFRPAILLPRTLAGRLSTEELRLVLLHEAGHLQRRDDWIGLAERLIRAIFCYQPAVAFIGRQIEREREMACDDWVLAQTGAPKPYAATLTRVAEFAAFGPLPFLANGSGRRKDIFSRLEALLDATRNRLPAISSPIAIVAALLLLFVVFESAPVHRLFGFTGYSDSFKMTSNDLSLEFKRSGDIQFLPNDQDVERMSPGAKLHLDLKADGVRRTVKLEADADGKIHRLFLVDGTEQPYDARAQRFFSKQLSNWLRDQCQSVPDRVARWVQQSSNVGALNEIQSIRNSHSRRIHLQEWTEHFNPKPEELRRALKIASSLDSDGEKREFLAQVAPQLAEPALQGPLFDFVDSIHGENERDEVFKDLLSRIPPAQQARLFTSVAKLHSEDTKAQLLFRAAESLAPVAAASYFNALATIHGLSGKRQVLDRLIVTQAPLPAALSGAAQRTIESMPSGVDREALLKALLLQPALKSEELARPTGR